MFNLFGFKSKKSESHGSIIPDKSFEIIFLDYEKLSFSQKSNYLVIDIGANEGKITKTLLDRMPLSMIHAFEPTPEVFLKLSQLFKEIQNVFVRKFALGSTLGTSLLNINSYNETNSLLKSVISNSNFYDLTKTKSVEEVNVITLDYYCSQNKIEKVDFIKMDVQGYEMEVLKGATNLLSFKKINFILLEVTFVDIYENQANFNELNNFLYNFGYNIVSISNHNYTENGQLAWCDILYKLKQ